MLIKIVISLFVLFAISRAGLRFRDRSISFLGLAIWTFLWVGVGLLVWFPKISDVFARIVGVGRGVDALVYVSIVALFYSAFRMYIRIETLEQEITQLVRKLALRETVSTEHRPTEAQDQPRTTAEKDR